MSIEKVESVVSRGFFFGAFVALVLGVTERAANHFGYTILRATKAVTLLEMAVVLLVFVIAIQLRAIRETLKHQP
jgi:succinate-acetate transporter protein